MAGRSKKQHAYRGVTQQSPFLDLPGEIRSLIYRAALTRPTPLDLYPHEFIRCPESLEELDERMSKPKNLGPKPRSSTKTIVVRDQYDLAYIRKEMATGLLGTCKQIRNESTIIFWRENTFRFSGDFGWEGIRRFLTTIGPDARQRLHHLELSPPWNLEAQSYTSPLQYYHSIAKNHPKLRMAKMLPVGRYFSQKDANLEHVLTMIKLEGFLKELRFIVPAGWICSQIRDPFIEAKTWGDRGKSLNWLEDIHRSRPLKVMLHLEPEGSLMGTQSISTLAYWGIGVVAQSGSLIARQTKRAPVEAGIAHEVDVLSIWPAERETDHVTGMDILFDDSEKMDVPARGGRVTKYQGKKKVERVLKGFGGCRFVHRAGYFCTAMGCGGMIVHPDKNFNKYRYFCARCRTAVGYEWKEEIAVRKATHEQRRDS
jgi:hypothetical protein